MKELKSVRAKTRLVKPIIVEEITSEKYAIPQFREKVVTNGIPDGHVRAIVIKVYNGMTELLEVGDIVDLPERRFRSLQMRGLVKAYEGDKLPNKRR